MEVVIFCGGRGTRLNEKTTLIPKPLVQIGKFPIIWHIMKIYSHYGYNDFILPLGYKGEEIKKWFLYYSWHAPSRVMLNLNEPKTPGINEKWKILFCNTGVKTGIAMRLYKVKDEIKSQQFHVTYGDGLSTIEIDKVLSYHNKMRKNHGIIGTISTVRPLSKYGIIDSDENGIIKSFREKPQMKEYVNIGFMVFEKEIFEYFGAIKKDDMLETSVFPKLAEKGKLALYKHEGFFMGMDSYKDYVVLNEIWKKEKKWKVWKN